MLFIVLLIKVIFVLGLIMNLASFCTWLERKGSALLQDRIGANRAGTHFETEVKLLKPFFWGLRLMGQLGIINTLFNDGVKAIMKEDFVPAGVSNFVHSLAPFLAVMPVFVAFAVLPLAPDFEVFGLAVRAQIASLDAGLIFLLACGGLAVYGPVLAGFTSNNKFALLGGLRTAAQMISYELALGVCFATVLLVYGTSDIYQMVLFQGDVWGVFYQPLTCLLLLIVGMAETKRAPFDLPESESELVAGYFTEYSGMKFLLFWLGEFAEIALFSLVLSLLFFGGWHLPGLEFQPGSVWGAVIGHLVLMAKVVFFCVLQIVIRWTLPRFRFDQLMSLGWKCLLPLSLINLLVYAVLKLSGFMNFGQVL